MKPHHMLALSILLAVGVASMGYLDRIDFGDKFFRRISSVVYEINAFKSFAEGMQSVCVSACALAGALWLFKRRNPKP